MKRLLACIEKQTASSPVLLHREVTTVLSVFCQRFDRRVEEILTISDEGYLKVRLDSGTNGYCYMDLDGDVLIELETSTQLVVHTFRQEQDRWQFISHQAYEIAGTLTPDDCSLAPRPLHPRALAG